MTRITLASLLMAALCPFTAPCTGAQSPRVLEADPTLSPMRGVIERFSSDQSSLQRFDSTPLSSERAERMRELYESARQRLADVEFASLNQDGKVDYLLLRNHLNRLLEQLEHERKR